MEGKEKSRLKTHEGVIVLLSTEKDVYPSAKNLETLGKSLAVGGSVTANCWEEKKQRKLQASTSPPVSALE